MFKSLVINYFMTYFCVPIFSKLSVVS